MTITIVGSGYVGLTTAVWLATLGHKVYCVDNNQDKVSKIQKGEAPFYEPGLDELLKKVLKRGLLSATDNLEESVLFSDITIIAVGTPTTNGKIDLTAIKVATKAIAKVLRKTNKYHVVVVKSTVLPGVTGETVKTILEKYSRKAVGEFGLCMNPEFMREGKALEDTLNPDRLVIGQIDEKSGSEFAKIYKKVVTPKIFTNLWTAEMIKYTANALLATLISFSNEIARISETTGKIDAVDVWKGVHLDKRLSPQVGKTRIRPGVLGYIFSGIGFGGSCFPKDIKALVNYADEIGVEASLIKSVIEINKTQPYRAIKFLKDVLGKDLNNKKIAILGLTFKADTDDIRESPALVIIDRLLGEGARVSCHDPRAYKEGFPRELKNPQVVLAQSIQEAIRNADAVVLVTDWNEYKKLKPKYFKENMKLPVVIDGRRIYDKDVFTNAGVIYKGIGL